MNQTNDKSFSNTNNINKNQSIDDKLTYEEVIQNGDCLKCFGAGGNNVLRILKNIQSFGEVFSAKLKDNYNNQITPFILRIRKLLI